jgi:plasmid maintenance system antidote protein VapI
MKLNILEEVALRRRIKECGKTVNAIAVGSGIPVPVLHRFYHGQRNITTETADKLTRLLPLHFP